MRVVLILQARMGSSRLPGKSMMDLAGAPLVGRMIERIKRCKSLSEIVLAIPDTELDLPLEELGKNHDIKVFKGSETNLVSRYYHAAKESRAEVVVRLPADNATPEPIEIDKIIDFHLSLKKPGFSSNISEIRNSGYPDGIGAEVFNFSLLEEIYNKDISDNQKEHLHLNFYNYETDEAIDEGWCPINTIICPKEYSRPDIILDVNDNSQYIYMKELYETLYARNQNFTITDIIEWHDNEYEA
tara:strand:+ start:4996 stop:5724 length:729 start_codon:yes stop_codon:yes gene_type:complete